MCSGSLPPEAAQDGYAELVRLAHARSVPVLVDTSGPALLAAARAGADVVKPNDAELRETLGESDPDTGARRLRDEGAGAVVVSLGARGMLAVTGEGSWRAAPPYPVRGNATGAGDAAVAALVLGMASGQPWPDRLRTAVALSAAAVAAPVAGSVDRAVFTELLGAVTLG